MARKRRRQKDDPVTELLTGLLVLTSAMVYFYSNSFSVSIITFVVLLSLIVGVQLFIQHKREQRLKRSGIYDVDKMEGRQFELYLGLLKLMDTKQK